MRKAYIIYKLKIFLYFLRLNGLARILMCLSISNLKLYILNNTIIRENKTEINSIRKQINAQINRTRTEESSPKNTTLYFNILLETKDLLNSIMSLMDEYYTSYKK